MSPRRAAPAPGPKSPAPSLRLRTVHRQIVACERCPRLRRYCQRVAVEKKAAYRHVTYWGRPVPGFGDPRARLLVVGLAPAAHGANRTGRVFTGDGTGGSGDFLMRALHDNGFASIPTSRSADDGLRLADAFIAAAVRCAPPGNKPDRIEIERCRPHLDAEWNALARAWVVVALGRIAFQAVWQVLAERGFPTRPLPPFVHGGVYHAGDGRTVVVASYHPSRQNTQTGRLTPRMLREVFGTARAHLDAR